MIGAMLFMAAVFIALGTWQVQRLFWKLDLIARVDARIHAAPVSAPGPSDWANITAKNDEYRRVTASGTFDYDKDVLVQAVTERGPGFWVLTPLHQPDGATILINRGFVPNDRRDRAARAAAEVSVSTTITGLLRMSEPGGAFLRSNDPKAGRWYSRDVAAIAAAEHLQNVAPYFIDADASANPGGLPVGGLTVVRFRNTHLIYALTWFGLALMSAGAAYAVRRMA
ncbi:SURF1-like protein [Brucella endophytica]|uniref:SURF1-like protein n=2 Tax=Brucella endophytica TaxID=1963359 RepID=A0A916S6Z0_9HYPH|nr:SURF1 family protein [Brucella endophytica]GGA87288.1 SURF1-like protein [Brucella endophytica]